MLIPRLILVYIGRTCHAIFIGPVKQKNVSVKVRLFSYPSVLSCDLGAQKNRLNETVLLSTHNICFG